MAGGLIKHIRHGGDGGCLMNGQEAITGKLNHALRDVRQDIAKIEILATTLAVFSEPVPGYISPIEQGGAGLRITSTVGR